LDLNDALSRFLDANPDIPEGQSADDNATPTKKPWPRLDISYERKGRGGRPATIISGFSDDISDDEIAELAQTLRRRLATGGSSRGGEILLQGDRRTQALEILTSLSIKARII
jgi:translation initiation factor 1